MSASLVPSVTTLFSIDVVSGAMNRLMIILSSNPDHRSMSRTRGKWQEELEIKNKDPRLIISSFSWFEISAIVVCPE